MPKPEALTPGEAAKELRSALTVLEEPSTGASSSRTPADTLKNAADALKHEATKVSMLFSMTGNESDRLFALNALVVAAICLLGYLRQLAAGAGPTMHGAILDVGRKVVAACVSLAEGCDGRTIPDKLPKLAGVVWECCEAVPKAPRTNRTAVGRRITKVAMAVKDCARELGEMEEAAPAGPEEAEAMEENWSDDDLDLDFAPRFSARDMEVVAGARPVVAGVQAMLHALLKALVSLELEETPDQVGELEGLLVACSALAPALEDLGVALYPDQDEEALGEALRAVGGAVAGARGHVGALRLGERAPAVGEGLAACDAALAGAAAAVARNFEARVIEGEAP